MLVAIAWAALRRRPFSVFVTLFLLIASAALLRVPVPIALLTWVLGSLLVLEGVLILEPFILERLGCRRPAGLEADRVGLTIRRHRLQVRIANDHAVWAGGALRTVVVSRGALESLEDGYLAAFLTQAALRQRAPGLLREIVVWLGNTPIVLAWCISGLIAESGEVLALVIGSALVVPLLWWPTGFVQNVGRVLGVINVAMLGAMLISGGLAAPGLGLWLGWPLVHGIRALLAWESRRAERDADLATLQAGQAWSLMHLLEFQKDIGRTEPVGLLRFLARPGSPIVERLRTVRRWIGLE
jgi:hypothetical protein